MRSVTGEEIKSLLPILHPWLHLHLLVTREHDSYVDISGICFLLPQEVVYSGLDVRSQSGGLQLLGRVFVVLPVSPTGLVTSITFKPNNIQMRCERRHISQLTLSRSAQSEGHRLGGRCDHSQRRLRRAPAPGHHSWLT